MALGADDVQAAGRDHLVVTRLPLGAQPRERDFVESGLAGLLFRPRDVGLELAAEHDVGAAARHIGGDGHLARLPACSTMCASRSCCLALSTSWSMWFLVSTPEISSELSIEVVPTSTG